MRDVSTLRFLLCRAGAARYAAPIERLRLVLPAPAVTPLPGTPPSVRGVASVRGELVTVVDARTLLGEPDTEPGPDLVLVDLGSRLVGLAVDEVVDLVAVDDDALIPTDGGGWALRLPSGDSARVLDLDALLTPLFPD